MRDLALRIHVWLFTLLFPPVVMFLSMRTLMRFAEWPRRWYPYAGIGSQRIVEIVMRRLKRPWMMRRRRCLRKGFTLFHFLRLAAVPAVLKVAVLGPIPVGKRAMGHCWVVVGGEEIEPPVQPSAVLLECRFEPDTAVRDK